MYNPIGFTTQSTSPTKKKNLKILARDCIVLFATLTIPQPSVRMSAASGTVLSDTKAPQNGAKELVDDTKAPLSDAKDQDTKAPPSESNELGEENTKQLTEWSRNYATRLFDIYKTYPFRTDAKNVRQIWCDQLPLSSQHGWYACWSCTNFFGYASLAFVDTKTLEVVPLFFTNNPDELKKIPPFYRKSIEKAYDAVKKATPLDPVAINRPFGFNPFSSGFYHFFLDLQFKRSSIPDVGAINGFDRVNEHVTMLKAIDTDYSETLLESAVRRLKEGKDARPEIVHGVIESWLGHKRTLAALNETQKSIKFKLWALAFGNSYVSSLRSGMSSVYLDGLDKVKKNEWSEDEFRTEWNAKSDPLQYQRSQVDPTQGQLDAAYHHVIKVMGYTAKDFELKLMTNDRLKASAPKTAWLWKEGGEDEKDGVSTSATTVTTATATATNNPKTDPKSNPFADLKIKEGTAMVVKEMTLNEFRGYLSSHRFTKILVATPDAEVLARFLTFAENTKPVFSWHTTGDPNRASWFYNAHNEDLRRKGIEPWHRVEQIVKFPHYWPHDEKAMQDPKFKLCDNRYLVHLANLEFSDRHSGALFPEMLLESLHPYRKSIEALGEKETGTGATIRPVVGLNLEAGMRFRLWEHGHTNPLEISLTTNI